MASSSTSIQQHYQHPAQASIVQASATPMSQQQHKNLPSNLVGRELKLIASSFVKQYYTLLNKAPCYIHNFYNHDSTFIHGTIEMGSDNHTEPVVGREKIEEKMKELQLNDCRAKIKQIDCLETLAGGLVLQVIGELSNDGKPMRRFLQTFVLAPSPDQTRHDGDPHTQNRANDNRRGVQISENSANSSHNQKFYVLNSIFRYQDDGQDSEFEDDGVSVKANTSLDNGTEQINNDGHNTRVKAAPALQPHAQQPLQQQQPQSQQPKAATTVEQPKNNPKPIFATDSATTGPEQQKRSEVKAVAPNGIANPVRKSETSEKVSNENGRAASNDNQSQITPMPTNNVVETSAPPAAAGQATSAGVTSTPAPATVAAPAQRPSNEPKTWANMVRNAIPPSTVVQSAATKEQPSLNQSNQAQNSSSQQQIPHQHHHQQQLSQSHNEHQQNNNTNNMNANNSNNNNNNNRRRHAIRKTSNNKTGNGTGNGGGNGGLSGAGSGSGRTIKNRPPRPATTAAPMGKPAA